MTDGIAAVAARITQLRSELGMAWPATGTTQATGTGTTGTTGTAGGTGKSNDEFAALLKIAQQKAADGKAKTAKTTAPDPAKKGTDATDGPPPANRTKSKIYGGADKLTPATRKLVEEIDSRFGPFPAIGGWRSDGGIKGGGEHPLGKAADFMLSTAGKLPGPDRRAKGDQIAEWAKKNAKRLGIKYIIWNQRIWNPDRASEGWRPMEDRGSITQNHKDHIHISMK